MKFQELTRQQLGHIENLLSNLAERFTVEGRTEQAEKLEQARLLIQEVEK